MRLAKSLNHFRNGRNDPSAARPSTSAGQEGKSNTETSALRPRSAGNAGNLPGLRRVDTEHPLQQNPIPKRVSRLVGEVVEVQAGLETFKFPLPSPSIGRGFHTQQSATPLAATADGAFIGIALGSPSHPPPSFLDAIKAAHAPDTMPRSRQRIQDLTFLVDSETSHLVRDDPPCATRKKPTWKSFSNLIRNKHAKQADSIASTKSPRSLDKCNLEKPLPQPSGPADILPGKIPQEFLSEQKQSTRVSSPWTRAQARAAARGQSDMATYRTQLGTPGSDESSSPGQVCPILPHQLNLSLLQAGSGSSLKLNNTAALAVLRLDLELPPLVREQSDITTEQNHDGEQSESETKTHAIAHSQPRLDATIVTTSRPSILERRADKMRVRADSVMRNDDEVTKPSVTLEPPRLLQRSLTSPSMHQLTSLTIKVNSRQKAEANTAFHRPRIIQRSNTIPAATPSPHRIVFAKDVPVLRTVPAILECYSDSPLTGGLYSSMRLLSPSVTTPSRPTSDLWTDSDDQKHVRTSPLMGGHATSTTPKKEHPSSTSGVMTSEKAVQNLSG